MTDPFARNVFGDPPPCYPCRVKAVRVNGTIVTGNAAKALASAMTFDLEVSTLDGVRVIENTPSYYPVDDPTVDRNGSNMIGARGWIWYIPEERALVPMIYMPPDSIDCADIP